MADAEVELLGDITDALARGRIAIAEIAAIAPGELDALYELAAQRLDTDRDEEAAVMFAGLVSLFPYSARYWRAYAIALHRRLETERARAAYDAALLLEPDHPATLCFRAEVLIYLGELEAAVEDIRAVLASGRGEFERRAEQLLTSIQNLTEYEFPPKPSPRAPTEPVSFRLGDGRTLPLEDSRYTAIELTEEDTNLFDPMPPELTHSAGRFVPELADMWEPPEQTEAADPQVELDLPERREIPEPIVVSGTTTAPLRHITATLPRHRIQEAIAQVYDETDAGRTGRIPAREFRARLREARLMHEADSEGTAVIRGRGLFKDVTKPVEIEGDTTGVIPKHVKHRVREAFERGRSGGTAVVRRRRRLPLMDDETQAFEPFADVTLPVKLGEDD